MNLGILAHVDAGKTSLTERLLFDAGVITEVGSVDSGSTQTDSMDLERRRGITIRSAVVSFTVDDLTVNLIDTPGHSDFIAEVERALRVLDGAVLVVSAVEGVQAQTRVLMRTLAALRIPTLVFVNKIDRMGARYDDLLADIRRRLTPGALAMSGVSGLGTRAARTHRHSLADDAHAGRVLESLAEHDDRLLASYVDGSLPADRTVIARELAAQTGNAVAHPVFFGSAMTGEGVPELARGIRDLLPPAGRAADGPLSGTVFKIERGAAGEKIAYLRLHSGAIDTRAHVACYRRTDSGAVVEQSARVTAIRVFERGGTVGAARATAGSIVQVWGLKDIRVGDRLGSPPDPGSDAFFAPPTLETVVRPRDPAQRPALYAALRGMTEQDPFINTRHDEERGELSVRLYGEVQKEVIEATLAEEFGVAVEFAPTRAVHLEKPVGVGEAVKVIEPREANEFWATIGLRVEPSAEGAGVSYRVAVELGSLPRAFRTAIEETVHRTLRRGGPHGWEVTDCIVTLTRSGFASPISTAGDFRRLTAQLLAEALRRAGTRVYEPLTRFEVEAPAPAVSGVLARLVELGGLPQLTDSGAAVGRVEGVLPASRVHEFERTLPGLTQGEGVFLSRFAGFRPVVGRVPTRG
ncbi:TetM/TetW/TetO/TetS family tetracycline resistance ribosomal protection protein [Solihabitans fulvus]|uniref:TetM/TetW/TetO/TetS family tetracycline resistance ribosomal protection protein n=1 Tax=Solihabitans fulvus TaxID=1892852 RepID=A0A5B2X3R8_9PSEU|nr:TetM/TetW/TetO/TetS family tetracycline resistance ribosomal protection protein [Solihabitans fulvus]